MRLRKTKESARRYLSNGVELAAAAARLRGIPYWNPGVSSWNNLLPTYLQLQNISKAGLCIYYHHRRNITGLPLNITPSEVFRMRYLYNMLFEERISSFWQPIHICTINIDFYRES